jgi:hypothetical protein
MNSLVCILLALVRFVRGGFVFGCYIARPDPVVHVHV